MNLRSLWTGPCWGLSAPPRHNTRTKGSFIEGGKKRGRWDGAMKGGGTLYTGKWRVLASVSNIHSQRVTFPPASPQPSDVRPAHMVPVRKPRAFLFPTNSVNAACFNPNSYNFAIKTRRQCTNADTGGGSSLKPTVEPSSACLSHRNIPWWIFANALNSLLTPSVASTLPQNPALTEPKVQIMCGLASYINNWAWQEAFSRSPALEG